MLLFSAPDPEDHPLISTSSNFKDTVCLAKEPEIIQQDETSVADFAKKVK